MAWRSHVAHDNNDSYFYLRDSAGPTFPTTVSGSANPRSNILLAATDPLAYWAIGYLDYFAKNRRLFHCPKCVHCDEWHDGGRYYPVRILGEFYYGLCQYQLTAFDPSVEPPLKKLTSYKRPSYMIFVQDAAESRMEGGEDNLGLFPGYSAILTQWI